MAEEEAEIIIPVAEEEKQVEEIKGKMADVDSWKPRTSIGKKIKSGETTLDEVLDKGLKIMEPEIVDAFIPEMETELLLIGQAKGKFGGGQRRVFKQTQKKTAEGNKPRFSTYVVIGNKNGYVGLGYGKAKETVPAREKAIRNAKLNLIKIRRGCGSWQCYCGEPHSVPFQVKGKTGSVRITLMPAPKGTGLRLEREGQKILAAAGIKDVWSKSLGQTRSKINYLKALEMALKQLMETKLKSSIAEGLGAIEGGAKA